MKHLDASAWLVWLAAALVVVFAVDHPVVDLLVTLASVVMVVSAPGPKPLWGFLALAAGFVVLRTVLFGLTGHTGATTLFFLPELHLPALLGGATLGGRVTAEVVASSISEGLRVMAVLAVFGVFLTLTEVADLLRLVPRFLFEAGLVVSIALVFAPQLARSAREIRDGQQMRGAGRRIGPTLIPTFATALERSVSLAESMDSRGYGRSPAGRDRHVWGLAAAAGALVSLGAWSLWALGGSGLAGLVALGGFALSVLALKSMSRDSGRTRYRRRRLGWGEWAVMLVALTAVAAALTVAGAGTSSFDPYDTLALMPPHPAAALAVLLLAAASLAVRRKAT